MPDLWQSWAHGVEVLEALRLLLPGREERSVNIAAPQYGIDTNWYMDSGATDHITGDLEKLIVRERYTGNEQIHTANGSGMTINHVGHTTIYTPDRELHLNNVLHVPEATKSLISASKLALDNDTFVEIHPHFFLSRIWKRRGFYFAARVGEVFILSNTSGETSQSMC